MGEILFFLGFMQKKKSFKTPRNLKKKIFITEKSYVITAAFQVNLRGLLLEKEREALL